MLIALAVVLVGSLVVLATVLTREADRTRTAKERLASATAAHTPVLVHPGRPVSRIAEADSSVKPGDLYSYLSVTMCLDNPGAVKVTGAEFDPDAQGVELVDIRVRRPNSNGWGSHHGTLDTLPFKATPGNVVTTACDSGESPDQVGLTVRRTGQQTGRINKVRFTYVDLNARFHDDSKRGTADDGTASARVARTDWFDNRWTFGPSARAAG